MTPREIFNLRARQQKERIRAEQKPVRRPRKPRKPPEPRQVAPSDYVTVRELIDIYHVSETGVYAAIKDGRLPSIKVGHNRCVRPVDYEAYRAAGREHRAMAARIAHQARAENLKKRRADPLS